MSNPLVYPFAGPPAVGQRQTVAPGIEWLRLPLPFDLDHVNVYLLRDGAQWLLLDTGMNTAATRDIWSRVLDGLPGGETVQHAARGAVSRVVVTHAHPDHAGLAGWLHERLGAGLSMSEVEWRMLSQHEPDPGATAAYAARVAAYWRRAGAPAAMVEWARARPAATHALLPPRAAFTFLCDGDTLRIGDDTWQVLFGRGHSPAHVCLYCAERAILIAGDQLLPGISPVVGIWEGELAGPEGDGGCPVAVPDADPLRGWLASLDRLEALPDDVLVLPAHETPFIGVRTRVQVLRERHQRKFARLLDLCREPQTTFALARALYPRHLGELQTLFACAETLAHTCFLLAEGRLWHACDGAGVDRWRAVP